MRHKLSFTAISLLISATIIMSFMLDEKDFVKAQIEYGPQIPTLVFIENVGQFDVNTRFKAQGSNVDINLANGVIWSTFVDSSTSQSISAQEQVNPTPTPVPDSELGNANQPSQGVNIKYSFVGANSNPQIEPFNRIDTSLSYFIGNDPSRWQSDVPVWGGVRYRDLYPGVDLEITGENNQWIWRLVAQNASQLEMVKLHLEGADSLSVANSGDLNLATAVGEIPGPTVISVIANTINVAEATSVYMQAIVEDDFVTFVPTDRYVTSSSSISTADASPGELAYSTLLGGSNFDAGNAIAAGSGGVAYVTGETYSTDFPTTPGAFDPALNGSYDIFITKLQSAGNAIAFSTFLGGSGSDYGRGIAVDTSGEIYLAGTSYSSNFPTTQGAFDTTFNGGGDVVVVKLNPTGNALLYSTFLGGSSWDLGEGVDVDVTGAAYVTGQVTSSNFPTTPGAFDTIWNGGSPYGDAFVTKLNPDGNGLEYSTFLGSTSEDDAKSIAVDSNGNAYVTGWTGSSNFPITSGAFDTTFAGAHDAFITKLNVSGSNLVYSGLLGGSGDDQGQGIAVDAFGAVYVTGQTPSNNFTITPGAYDTTLSGYWDGFVTKISSNGSQLIYSTYLGGSGNDCETVGIDRECVIAVDDSGVTYVAGRTFSTNFPTTSNGFATTYNGNEDGFMVRLNPAGNSLIYGSFFGGTSSDQTLAVAVDTAGAAYIAGRTSSSNFPTSTTAFDTTYGGNTDAFAIKLLVGGYVSGPLTDPDTSTINIQPASLPADGVTQATISVQLFDTSGNPAWGKTVWLSSSRGAQDYIIQPVTVTDSSGRATGFIRSTVVGPSDISVWVLDDGILLSNTATATFETYTPPTSAFLFQLNQCVDTTIDNLNYIKTDAESIADNGTYFRGAIGADTAKLAADVVFDMADVIGGLNQTFQLQKAARLACPGCYVPGTWNVQYGYNHPDAARLLDIGFTRLEDAPVSKIAEFIGFGGAQFFGKVMNAGARYVTKEQAKNATEKIFVNQNDGMTSIAYPSIRDTTDTLTYLIDIQRNDLLDNLPAMTLDHQNGYEDDFMGRSLAGLVLGQQLRDERVTLANLRQVHSENPNALFNFLLRFVAKGAATAFFDGPGTVAVNGTLLAFDGYMDGKSLGESTQMYYLAMNTLLGAPDTLRQTYSNCSMGLERVIIGLDGNRATGQVNDVIHYSQGSGWGPFWKETASWSEVSLTNTGSSETTFRVLVDYLADTERFGVPWGTMNLVEESSIILAPNASGTVRVDYKRADGTKGFSPRSDTCIPIFGCVPASTMNIQVLGTNDAGTYYIDNHQSKWQPISTSNLNLLQAEASLSIIDPPLTTYILSAPWLQEYEAQLWINNPFTYTVPVTVFQVIPASISLGETGGASQTGDTLTWQTNVSPTALNVVTFTFKYPAIPGTSGSLPPATLSLINPLDGQPLSDTSNAAQFEALWPLTLNYATPGYVLPESTSQTTITITNWLSDTAINGTLVVSVTDTQSNTIHTETQPFNVAASGVESVNFTLPGLAKGYYRVNGQVSTSGASMNAFTDLLQSGLPGPWLNYQVSPTGMISPNEVLTYTLQFNNSLGVPLSDAVVTASIPISVAIVDFAEGGIIETDEIRWDLNDVAKEESVEKSFVVVVNDDAKPAGIEPGRLLSLSYLTANEIMPTQGPLVWNLVTEANKPTYLPIILKN